MTCLIASMKFNTLTSIALAFPSIAAFPLDSPAWVSAVGRRQVEGSGEPLPLPTKPPPFNAKAQKVSVSGEHKVSTIIANLRNKSSSHLVSAFSLPNIQLCKSNSTVMCFI